jgi:excisionase family DNA binding protein
MMKITNLATHPDKYATTREVAAYLHASPRYVQKLIAAGTLKAMRGPRGSSLVRVSVASVRRAIREPPPGE